MRFSVAIVVAMLCTAVQVYSGDGHPEWDISIEKAKKQAKEQDKPRLVILTGKEWDDASKKFHRKILDTDKFEKFSEDFVISYIAIPDNPADLAKDKLLHVQRFVRDYQLEMFCVVIMFDSEGRSLAAIQYVDGDFDDLKYLMNKAVAISKVRDAILGVAEIEQRPIEKARLMSEALSVMRQIGPLVGYDKEIDEILRLDAHDKLGLREFLVAPRRLNEIWDLLQQGKAEEANKKVDKFLEEFTNDVENTQMALFYKASISADKGRLEEALEHLLTAFALAPDSARAPLIKGALDSVREKLRSQTQTSRGNPQGGNP